MKLLSLVVLCGAVFSASAADKKIVLLAGNPSHGPGDHEYRAGSLLFQKCLASVPGVNVTFTLHADLGCSLEQVVFTEKSEAFVPLTCAPEMVTGTFVEILLRVDACGKLLVPTLWFANVNAGFKTVSVLCKMM